MKSMATCYSKHSIQISDSYCSSSSNCKPSSSQSQNVIIPSVQNSVTCLYRSRIRSQEEEEEDDDDDDDPILTSIAWTSNLIGRGYIIQIKHNSTSSCDQVRKNKGSKTITIQSSSRFEVHWDLSSAEYDNGPQPTSNFYIMVCKNSKPILLLGDYEEHKMMSPRYATFVLVSRTECFSGSSLLCMTKAQFCDSGIPHDIVIKYVVEVDGGLRDHMLIVTIDKKKVVIVKKLQWNFRGNQCVFVDGIVVDLMWDVHEWLFNPVAGNGVFLFRTRSGFGSRLWLVRDERMKKKRKEEKERLEFSLMLIADRKHPN